MFLKNLRTVIDVFCPGRRNPRAAVDQTSSANDKVKRFLVDSDPHSVWWRQSVIPESGVVTSGLFHYFPKVEFDHKVKGHIFGLLAYPGFKPGCDA